MAAAASSTLSITPAFFRGLNREVGPEIADVTLNCYITLKPGAQLLSTMAAMRQSSWWIIGGAP